MSAKGLDKSADYGTFAQSLVGNLVWALSGVLPGAPMAVLAASGLQAFFKAKWTTPSPGWAAAVGTAGAMLAQFAAGIPSTANSSDLKIKIEEQLTRLNSSLCNSLRRTAYEYLADAVASSPPEGSTSAQHYAADLDLGLRHALYGEVYSKGLNDGDLPDAGKIQADARDQLLRQYVVSNAAISDGEVVGTKAVSDRAEVGAAVDLVGGKEALRLSPYELVVNQIRAAAADLNCTISLDAAAAAKTLGNRDDLRIPVTAFSAYHPNSLFASMPTWWFRMITQEKLIKLDPEFDGEPYMSAGGIKQVSQVVVRSKDLNECHDRQGAGLQRELRTVLSGGRREGERLCARRCPASVRDPIPHRARNEP